MVYYMFDGENWIWRHGGILFLELFCSWLNCGFVEIGNVTPNFNYSIYTTINDNPKLDNNLLLLFESIELVKL